MVDRADQIRAYWNEDAHSYDRDPGHHPSSPLVRAAWRAALESLLPTAPARVLDVGAGTGFLTVLALELGHQVTALDLSSGMLERLRAKVAEKGLSVEVLEGDATEVPAGPYDAVMSRHLLWTLPDPAAALRAWRASAPEGELVLLDTIWGGQGDPVDSARRWTRSQLRRWRGSPPAHHAEYPPEVRDQLPMARGSDPGSVLSLVLEAGWSAPRLHRLRDVAWAARQGEPWPDRLLGNQVDYGLVALARGGSGEG